MGELKLTFSSSIQPRSLILMCLLTEVCSGSRNQTAESDSSKEWSSMSTFVIYLSLVVCRVML